MGPKWEPALGLNPTPVGEVRISHFCCESATLPLSDLPCGQDHDRASVLLLAEQVFNGVCQEKGVTGLDRLMEP